MERRKKNKKVKIVGTEKERRRKKERKQIQPSNWKITIRLWQSSVCWWWRSCRLILKIIIRLRRKPRRLRITIRLKLGRQLRIKLARKAGINKLKWII
jgi:hypothetical protein